MLTDKEKADFEKGAAIARAKWDQTHADPEESFKAAFIAQGHSPERAAVMAKIAKDGRIYNPRGL